MIVKWFVFRVIIVQLYEPPFIIRYIVLLLLKNSIFVFVLIILFLAVMILSSLLPRFALALADSDCVKYLRLHNIIRIICGSVNLTDISNVIKNPKILKGALSNKVWILKANLEVENRSKLYINSTDTSWLKIDSSRTNAYHIQAKGDLLIDSVKITGWDTSKRNYATSDTKGSIPRAYILTKKGTGMTNITRSEIAYLGYGSPNSFGLTYYTGAGSIIRNNKIHNLWYGFYSSDKTAHNIIIQNNKFYNNRVYGIDPHSGSHDLVITNNEVYNNGRHGIICSTDCYNILIASNKVFKNTAVGIMLHNKVSNSIIKSNIVYDNKDTQIALLDSVYNNHVFDNNIRGGDNGVRIDNHSQNNNIHNNSIANASDYGIYISEWSSRNIISHNLVIKPGVDGIRVEDSNLTNNKLDNNKIIP
jgi:poly(beta-D-mannuronate) C5 epimerase